MPAPETEKRRELETKPGAVRLPQSSAAPLAILAKDTRGLTEQVLRELDPPLQAIAGTSPPAWTSPDHESLAVEIDKKRATASPAELCELGLTTAAMGLCTLATTLLRDCVKRAPNEARAWRKLADLLRLAGKAGEAAGADAAAERASSGAKSNRGRERPRIRPEKSERKLRERLRGKSSSEITTALRNHLIRNPEDAGAMRLFAQCERDFAFIASRLLERALDLCPDYIGAREDYTQLLLEQRADSEAAAQTKLLLAHAPRDLQYRHSYAFALLRTGDFDAAIEMLTGLVAEQPREAKYRLLYAQALRWVGRRDDCLNAYRRCLELEPEMGRAWWGIAELKGKFISEADVAAIRAQLNRTKLEPDSRMHMLYALAQTLEQAGDFAGSFAAYDEGARQFQAIAKERRKGLATSRSADHLKRMKVVFSRENLATKLVQAPAPATRDTPVFVVGMPRAGSTLVEQILASHSEVEGTRELTLIQDIANDLAFSRLMVVNDAYPGCVLDLAPEQLAAFGTRYIERSRDHRKTTRPWFVDKRPWNWLDVGLIHLILPQAKFIDVRREPMAACFAMFKQLLPEDASFSYDLDALGRYYNNYVAMMQHWHSVLPGRVHFIQYERLVEDTETEIRRMLDYCGLPFEENCLRFWETERAVATPSAEQVRRPIYRDAVEQWRNFEPWLGPLKKALSQPASI